MGRPKKIRAPLPPIWVASDDLWAISAPILAKHDPPKPRGRKRINQRAAFDAIIFRLRTGCQWNHLPTEYPDDNSVHRTFQRWVTLGIFDRIWAVIQEACEDLHGCAGYPRTGGEWQAAEATLDKARSAAAHQGGSRLVRIPLNRAQCGSTSSGVKKSLIVEVDGGPLGITVAGANVPDAQLLDGTIRAIVLQRPPVEEGDDQHLAMDKGYDNDTGYGACLDHAYVPHIALKRHERPSRPVKHPTRRWVIERTLGWLSMCRGILVRWEKKSANYLGMLKLACGLIWFRRYHRLADLR